MARLTGGMFLVRLRVEVIRGLSNPLHPAQRLIMEWKTRENSTHGYSNGEIFLREYAPKQSHTRLDPRQIDDLIVAYQAGSTIKKLAAQFQIHHTTVSNVLERCGVPRRYRPLTSEQIKHAIKAYQAGSSSKMIGDLLGMHPSTICRTLEKNGIELRDCHGHERKV